MGKLRYAVTVCAASPARMSTAIGLIFVDLDNLLKDPTEEDISRILMHDDLLRIFGTAYWGGAVSWCAERSSPYGFQRTRIPDHRGVFVSTNNEKFGKAGLTDAVYYLRNSTLLVRASTADAFDTCTHLMKIIGCERCTVKPYNCIPDNLPAQVPLTASKDLVENASQLALPHVASHVERVPRSLFATYWSELDAHIMDYDDWQALKLKHWKANVAGYTVISPQATSALAPAPDVKSVRPLHEHTFRDVEDVRKRLSERAVDGAATRKTIREQCAKCYLGSTSYTKKPRPCFLWRARYCEHGAWSEERLVDYTLEHFERALAETPFDLESMWRVAWVSGAFFKHTSPHTQRPQEWVISRLQTTVQTPVAVVAARTSQEARGETQYLESPADVYAFLDEALQARWDAAPPIDRARFATWVHPAVTREGLSYALGGGMFGSYAPAVGWVCLDRYSGVEVCWWTSRKIRTVSFQNLKEVYNYYADLPFFGAADVETDRALSLSARRY